MIRYLLGDLAEGEKMRLEEEYFSDDDLFAEIEAAETDLIDAYVRGGLGRRDREQFEARYLASPRHRERIAFARRMAEDAARATRAGDQPHEIARRPGGFMMSWRVLVPLMATAVVVVAVSATWWAHRRIDGRETVAGTRSEILTPPTGKPSDVARPTAPPPAPNMPASGVVALVLAPDLTRGPGEGVSLAVPASASVVRITLQHEGESHASYRVVIRTPEDAEVWSASAVKPVKGGQSAVVVDVPASRLSPNNDYVVALSALAPDGASEALADYSFRVVRESSRAIRR